MSLRYEVLHEYEAFTTYPIVNEDVEIWNDLLQGLRVENAAGICSGGEVAFFSLLPITRGKLTLVDHSVGSLAYAMAKYLMLEERGAEETYRLFTQAQAVELESSLRELNERLPVKFVDRNLRYHTECKLRGGWEHVPQASVRAASTRLGRVSFVHGDLTDLRDRGPVGLLYVSNAHEHTSRTRLPPVWKSLSDLVEPGGFVCAASQSYRNSFPAGWTQVSEFQGKRVEGRPRILARWRYMLYQKPASEMRAA